MNSKRLLVLGDDGDDFISELCSHLAVHGILSLYATKFEELQFAIELTDHLLIENFNLREHPQIEIGAVWQTNDLKIGGCLTENDKSFAIEEVHAAMAAVLNFTNRVIINPPLSPLSASRVNDPFIFKETVHMRGDPMCNHGLKFENDYSPQQSNDIEWCDALNNCDLFLMKKIGREKLWFAAKDGVLVEELKERQVPHSVTACAERNASDISLWYFDLVIAANHSRVYPRAASSRLCAATTRPFIQSVGNVLAKELKSSFGDL